MRAGAALVSTTTAAAQAAAHGVASVSGAELTFRAGSGKDTAVSCEINA